MPPSPRSAAHAKGVARHARTGPEESDHGHPHAPGVGMNECIGRRVRVGLSIIIAVSLVFVAWSALDLRMGDVEAPKWMDLPPLYSWPSNVYLAAAPHLAPKTTPTTSSAEWRDITCSFSSRGGSCNITTLVSLLKAELAAMEEIYGPSLSRNIHFSAERKTDPRLGDRLSAVYFNDANSPPFVVGIAAGSASAFDFSWPSHYTKWFKERLNITMELRNAAQGSTSQFSQAPCLHSLVGTDVDLLFWEFAMNEEALLNGTSALEASEIFGHHAETYMRQAIALDIPSHAFLFIWDGRISGLRMKALNFTKLLPDREYSTLVQLLDKYSVAHHSMVAMNVIRMITQGHIFANYSDVLMDGHHPSRSAFRIIGDLAVTATLRAWLFSLEERRRMRLPKPSVIPVAEVPLLARNNHTLGIMPQQSSFSHCFITRVPQFGKQTNTIKLHSPSSPKMVNFGKSSLFRNDRTYYFVLGECGRDPLVLNVTLSKGAQLSHILIGCGKLQGCPRTLRVMIGSQPISSNVPGLRQSSYRIHFGFAHKAKLDDSQGTRVGFSVTVCRESKTTTSPTVVKDLEVDDEQGSLGTLNHLSFLDALNAPADYSQGRMRRNQTPPLKRRVFFERLVVVEVQR